MPIAAAVAIATAASGVYAAHKASSSADSAAKLQTDAAKYGADKQDAATQRAEAFQRQQAEQAWQEAERNQRANWEQSSGRQHALANLGSSLGMNLTVPDYVAGVDPHFDQNGTPLPSSQTTPNAGPTAPGGAPQGINWTAPSDQLAQQISSYYKSKGVSDHETPYWVGKAAELVARGKELGDPAYADKRLAASEVFGGGGAKTSGTLGTAMGLSMPSMAPPAVNTPLPTPYQPGTIGAYVGGRVR